MSKTIKDVIVSSRVGKIAGLAIAIYGVIWGIIEPMGFGWIEKHKIAWRIALPSLSAVVTAVLSIPLISKVLEKLHADGIDRTMQNSYSSTGNPIVTIKQDGRLGNVVSIKGQYENDELDWPIKSAAQTAGHLEVIFKHNRVFYFYLRIVMISKEGTSQTTRWLRFDNSLAVPDIFREDPHEMGVGFQSDILGSFNKATIDIKEAVKKTFGQAGWSYEKATIFRIRCDDGMVASVTFKR